MKRLYFFTFFVLNFLSTFSSNGVSVDVCTKLNLVKPANVVIKKVTKSDELDFKLDNSKEEAIKVYIKESNSNTKIYNTKNINGKLALNSKQTNLKNKVTVRVMYN
ncbi:MAG: hypothetical protein ACRDB6_08585 [Cetobacterium sp.]